MDCDYRQSEFLPILISSENGAHTFGSGEMQDISIFSEHVDFLYTRDRLDIQFLQCALEFFVVLCTGGFARPHDFTTHSTLATYLRVNIYIINSGLGNGGTDQYGWKPALEALRA